MKSMKQSNSIPLARVIRLVRICDMRHFWRLNDKRIENVKTAQKASKKSERGITQEVPEDAQKHVPTGCEGKI